MNVEAGWLLRNQKYIVSRRRFLETLLKDSEKMLSVDEKDIIDVITYMRRVREASASADYLLYGESLRRSVKSELQEVIAQLRSIEHRI